MGLGAIASSTLYVVSDVMELAAGNLFTAQLVVTYLAEASIPFFVLGLNGLQQPQGGWASLAGALMYGFAFVGLSATVLYPMVTGVRDADVVFDAFGVLYDLTVAGLPEEVQTVATAVRSVAFAGMGAACLRTRSSRTPAP